MSLSLDEESCRRRQHLLLLSLAVRQLILARHPSSHTHSCIMAPVSGSKKRNKSAINPKIHIKGIKKVKHEDDEVDEVRAHTDSESEDDESGTRASAQHVDHDSDNHDDDDDENPSTKKGTKPVFLTKEQKREQKKKAAKAKLNQSDKNERTIFVGNLPSNCEPKVSITSHVTQVPRKLNQLSL